MIGKEEQKRNAEDKGRGREMRKGKR